MDTFVAGIMARRETADTNVTQTVCQKLHSGVNCQLTDSFANHSPALYQGLKAPGFSQLVGHRNDPTNPQSYSPNSERVVSAAHIIHGKQLIPRCS